MSLIVTDFSHRFLFALWFLSQWEGGLSDHRNDRGGLTRYGISAVANPDVDVANLTFEGAVRIYERKYYTAVRGEEVPFLFVPALLGSSAHHGPGRAARLFQEAIGGITADGVIGPATLAAVRERHPLRTLDEFIWRRLYFMHRIVVGDSSQEDFARGWFRRVVALHRYCVAAFQLEETGPS